MSESKMELNDFKDKQLSKDKINENNDKSILHAKELITKLLQNTLNTSLLKLESNHEVQIASLRNTSKNFNEFSKILNNLTKNVEEMKKKKLKEKEKDKKAQVFKRGRKIVTETNLNARSKTIELTLNNFKNRTINIDGKKNLLKINKKSNLNGHKQGNRTMSSFRNINEIENDRDTITSQRMQKFKNISYQNTSQNFRKGKNKVIPATPVIKLREKEKNQLLTKAINSRKFNYKNVKNNHSRTVILSHLTDIVEKSEKIENDIEINKKMKTNNKNVKRVIYKNENRNKVVRINEKKNKAEYYRNTNENLTNNTRMKTSDDINHNINNSNSTSNNINTSMNSNKNTTIEKTNELKNIVKLVDDVNENLNKLLKQNIHHNKRRSSLKDMFVKNQSTNALITEIKDVKIKEIQNNSLNKNYLDNTKNVNSEIEGKEKKTIPKSYSLNDFIKKENIINIKRNGNTRLKIFKNIYNNIKKIKNEGFEKSLIKRNKSFIEPKNLLSLFELNNKKNITKSTKNIFEKTNTKREIKKKMLMKKIEKLLNKTNNKIEERNQIINHIIKTILDKTKEKIEIINKQKNKEIDKQKQLSDKTNEEYNTEKNENNN